MTTVHQLLDLVLHLDKHLQQAVLDYGLWVYLILFTIIFCETGLVVTPFLPGDSLLFAVGSLAAAEGSSLDVRLLFLILLAAAVIGNTTNYHIGRAIGPRALKGGRLVKKQHLDRTHEFFVKHGGKTIVLTRFVPILRTIAPFVAGVGAMGYAKFQAYNVAGGLAWVGSLLLAGYFFGNLPLVKNNFSLVVIAIVVISVLPAVFEWVRARRHGAGARAAAAREE